MNKYLKSTFLTIVGIASILVILGASLIAIIKIDHALTEIIETDDIELQNINHWQSGSNIIFATTVVNKSNINWEFVAVRFILKLKDGTFFKECETSAYVYPLQKGPLNIEVICSDMPDPMPEYMFETKILAAE